MAALNNFYYASSLLETLYGITLLDDVFEEIALTGWNLIGNKRSRLYRFSGRPVNGLLELPCNADEIEAITESYLDSATEVNRDSVNVEEYIESVKEEKNPLYVGGKYVKYERVGNTLYFSRGHNIVNILYRGEILDDSGLPLITDKEAMALATYCAYVTKFKEGITTNNANIILLANTLKVRWDLLVDLARTDYYMSQNEWDEILDARSNWDRKIHSKSFKIGQ